MKDYFLIFFTLVIAIQDITAQSNVKDPDYYPNNVSFHVLYNQANFYNINGKPVTFNGINLGIFSGWKNKVPLYFGFTFYYPKSYNGQLILVSSYDSSYKEIRLLNAPVKGTGLSLEINFTVKSKYLSFTSKSEDFGIYPQIGFTALTHSISFNYNEISYDRLSFWCTNLQGLTLGTINLGIYSRIRITNIPFCVKLSQNFIVVTNNFDKIKVNRNYSSYLNVGIGFTFPVTKGPGVSKIKTIHYK